MKGVTGRVLGMGINRSEMGKDHRSAGAVGLRIFRRGGLNEDSTYMRLDCRGTGDSNSQNKAEDKIKLSARPAYQAS